jgi:outer membrane protein assembly factor BamB
MADPRALDALGRHWDAVTRGAPVPASTDLDPALAETVARLHAVDDLPPPDPVFAARLWQELRVGGGRAGGGHLVPATDRTAVHEPLSGARPEVLARPRRRLGGLWGVLELAAAILLLLIPIGGYFAGYRVLPELTALWPGGDGNPEIADVPLSRGNAAQTGEMPGPGPAGSPSEDWRFDPGMGADGFFSPVVADGLVFVGTEAGYLVAIDADSGEDRWRFSTDGAIVSEAPAIADGVIYVVSQDAFLYAVDAATGAERWRQHVGSSPATLTVADGVLYVADNTNFTDRTYLAVADGLVIINGCACGSLRAFDATTGQSLWTYSPGAAGLFAVDAATGTERWSRMTDRLVTSAPTIAGGVVYAVEGDDEVLLEGDATLLAIDAANGDDRWRYPLGSSTNVNRIVTSAPAVVDGVVYVGTAEGELHAIDATTGAIRWEYAVGRSVNGSPVVTNGTVYVVDAVGDLIAHRDAPRDD